MGLVHIAWQFRSGLPLLERVAEDFRSSYLGPVRVEFVDEAQESIEGVQVVTRVGETPAPRRRRMAVFHLERGQIEITENASRFEMTTLISADDDRAMYALTSTLEGLGGVRAEPAWTPGHQTPQRRLQIRSSFFFLTYVILLVSYLKGYLSFLGCAGLVVLFLVLRAAVGLLLAYRRARRLFPQVFDGRREYPGPRDLYE